MNRAGIKLCDPLFCSQTGMLPTALRDQVHSSGPDTERFITAAPDHAIFVLCAYALYLPSALSYLRVHMRTVQK